MHRAELARRTGLSRTTVSTIMTELLDEELVVEGGGDSAGGGGRRSGLLVLNPKAGVVLGVDLSLTHARVAVANRAQIGRAHV